MTERLDAALVRRGLVPSREKAKAAVAAGLVRVNGVPAAKPSAPVGDGDEVEVDGAPLRYVGRGGLKLEKALAAFGIGLAGTNCIDVGASTGGFTDCMLQAGAARVAAVDVGHGQLDARLAADARVACFEGTDVRAADAARLGGPFDFAATDVSFISLAHVLGPIAALLRADGQAVCLVKPQFEAGPEKVGKKGVVKDPAVHREVLARVLTQVRAAGLEPRGLDFSPVTGGSGNVEYLLHAVKTPVGTEEGPGKCLGETAVDDVVAAACKAFGPPGVRRRGGSDPARPTSSPPARRRP